ncbi:MAG: OmpA family protein, partial [Planctomycetota bacterium]
GGCVTTEEYTGAQEAANTMEARIAELIEERDSFQRALADRNASDQALRDQNAQLRQERAALASDIEQLRERINTLGTGISNVGLSGLDPATDADLRRLASRYDVMSYDPGSGRIAFASDLTFPSGSDTVRDGAKNTLQDLARILSTADGGNYLIYIEGHTDSQRPSNPATLRNHPTNRHLSAHRAIAVGNVLKAQGVADTRVFTGGWGASRPAVPNAQNGNTPANRRVEIYLVADTRPAAASGAATSTPAAGARATQPAPDAPMK